MSGKPNVTEEHRLWAAQVLNLSPDHDAEKLAEAALQRLADDDFVLWEQADLAVRILAGSKKTAWSEVDLATMKDITEQHLSKSIEKFCQTFFQLEPEPRQEQFQHLSQSCEAFPALSLRLEQLQPGLELESWSQRKARAASDGQSDSEAMTDELFEFGNEVVNMFLTHPNQRGRLERALKNRWADRLIWIRNNARNFSSSYPAYANLAPGFVRRIQSLNSPSSRWRTRTTTSLSRYQETDGTISGGDWLTAAIVVLLMVGFVSIFSLFSESPTPPVHTSNDFVFSKIQAARNERIANQFLKAALLKSRNRIENSPPSTKVQSTNENGAKGLSFIPFAQTLPDGSTVTIFTESELDYLLITQPEIRKQLFEKYGIPTEEVVHTTEAPEPVTVDNENIELLYEIPSILQTEAEQIAAETP